MEDSESLRNQIDRLEGSLKDLQNKNANYADMTLVLADASQEMDYNRFVGSIVPPEKTSIGHPNLQVSPTKEKPELDIDVEYEVDDVTFPSMGRFGEISPLVRERESQIDLRDFNDLKAPEDLPDDYPFHSSFLKGLGSDRSDDYDLDTPQDQCTDSCPIGTQYSRTISDEYCDKDLIRVRSKTESELPENRSVRTNSQVVEPVISRGFDESMQFDDPMRVYPNQSADYKRRIEVHHYRDDISFELSPIQDIETTDDLSPMEDNCDVEKAISTLEDSDVIYTTSNTRVRRGSRNSGYSGEGNDSDSDIDDFISQYKHSLVESPQEEVRPKSPYYQRPISKSSLGSYQNTPRAVSPRNIILRKKEAPQDPQKRLTLPPQAMGSYDDYGPRTPGPYMSKTSGFNTPQPNLKFRPVQSAGDQYDTVLSMRRKSTIDSQTEQEPESEMEYRPTDVLRHNAQRFFNRNKTTDHRKYSAYSRPEMISPTSPPQETSFEDQDGYEIIVNSSEITSIHQPTQYRFQHEHTNRNSAYSGYNVQQRQPTRPRNEYAVPAPVGVARNHGYIPNNDNTSPVQSLDSGIDSLFNDHRPRTAAAQTVYYQNEFDDYEERPRESLKEMENMVSQLRNELKVLTTKVNLFESKGINMPDSDPTSPTVQSRIMPPTGLPGPSLPPQPRGMSPTGQKYSTYAPTHLRSSSVANNNVEGGKVRQDPRNYEVGSAVTSVSPVQSYHPKPVSKYSQPHKSYSTEYETPAREPMYQSTSIRSNLKKPVYAQISTPNTRPKSVSKITSNTVNSSRSAYPTNTYGMDPVTKYTPGIKNYTPSRDLRPSIPRAQSSTGTAAGARLQPSRYIPAPKMDRSMSPQPITSARKPNPSRPISSNSHRFPGGYYHDEGGPNQQTNIPKSNQRYH